MFTSISGPELLMILILGLLLFGPRKLPQIGRTVGKAFAEFRRATTDFKMNLEREVEASEIKEAVREVTSEIKEAVREVDKTVREFKPEVSGPDDDPDKRKP